MSDFAERWARAEARALEYGCVPENLCWDDCVQVWLDEEGPSEAQNGP